VAGEDLWRYCRASKSYIEWLGMPPVRATMFAVATGIFSAIGLLILLLATDYLKISRSNRWGRRFRHMADGTFTIYLMHYPFLVLLLFAGLLHPGRPMDDVFLGVGMCAVLIAVAVPIDKFKLVIRRWLRSYGKVYRNVVS
jgi:peptidoglycan/LPS O-acetylase OafA/YrhL